MEDNDSYKVSSVDNVSPVKHGFQEALDTVLKYKKK